MQNKKKKCIFSWLWLEFARNFQIGRQERNSWVLSMFFLQPTLNESTYYVPHPITEMVLADSSRRPELTPRSWPLLAV